MNLEFSAQWLPVFIFFARIVDVSLGTLRTIMVVRSRLVLASLLGFVEVTIWVIAISNVVNSLSNPWNVLGWAGGFAAGNAVGIWIERRIAMGDIVLRVISRDKGEEMAQTLRDLGQPVTEFEGKGKLGPVKLLYVVIARAQARFVERAALQVDPECILVSEDTRSTHLRLRPTMVPRTGWRSIVKKK